MSFTTWAWDDKTRIALEVFKHFKEQYPQGKLCVISPIVIMESGWGDDIKKFTEYKYFNTRTLKKGYRINEVPDILLFNYESVLLSPHINYTLLNVSDCYPCLLVCDESSKIKSPKSKITKLLLKIKNNFTGRICMSGTPAPNCDIEFYTQLKLITDDNAFKNYYAFQAKYFMMARGNQLAPAVGNTSLLAVQGYKLKINPSMKEQLYDEIKKYSIFEKKENCLDLPKKIFTTRIVNMSVNQRKVYDSINKLLWVELKDNKEIATQTVLAKIMKLRQITSGFLYDEDKQAHDIESSKLNEMWNVIEEIGFDKQIVIFANFKYEISCICKFLESKGKTVGFLNADTDDRDQTINDYKSGKSQYLICHPKSAGMGLNLQHNASDMIWYSMSYSYAEYAQACDRIHRIGQELTCNYVHLICDNSIDETLLNVIKNKGEANDFIYEYMNKTSIFKEIKLFTNETIKPYLDYYFRPCVCDFLLSRDHSERINYRIMKNTSDYGVKMYDKTCVSFFNLTVHWEMSKDLLTWIKCEGVEK